VKNHHQTDRVSQWEQFRASMFCTNWKWEVMVEGTVQAIVKAIHNGCAITVSNGSFKDCKGAAVWMIEGYLGQDKITGACLVPGMSDDHSAFCSKLMGLLGTLLTVKYMLEGYGLTDGTLMLCCDGKLALGWVASLYPIAIMEPHANILSAIVNVHK